ncbi:putative Hsp20/alpha crystallin family protein [Candidatus Nitrosotenuis uzonensis]|uniref:Putative Hsp20/alpha crystallin family protein n=2 Tax=Candidatus Nitrosotenuis uzonensis TaxID=1407055 RepID=A0A812F3J9_9ARCH|nr:putative Hsp20/alpha crystallin family protein [Candidatus Nitrosotenuis uzonensis]
MGLLAVIIKLSKLITKNSDLDKMGIVNYMAKEVAKEIGNKSREFYEFVLPPVDMYLEDDSLIAVIDLPGFDKKDIRLTLNKNILSITAEKHESRTENPVYKQRPRVIDKKIPLPVQVKDDDVISAKLVQGVLTVRIPIVKNGKQISIE